ncbi:hypothetical protein [Pedobacter sp. UBA5917]|jgi:hypothetical protein|uniref:hypothetical protein n=1 Tax=Pedobacter sp. UBA5917 TaxID=1947061 RepID=UPI0025F814ED|nr:hypothetical protein [Pedobacter sp. UBA5917]
MIKKNRLIFFVTPFLLLSLFYFSNKKSGLHNKFERFILSDSKIKSIDTIFSLPNEEVDEIKFVENTLWINKRFSIVNINKDGNQQICTVVSDGQQPIINFYIYGDSLYYYQAGKKEIKVYNLKLKEYVKDVKFDFFITYFSKMDGSKFMFQQSNTNGSDQLHFLDLANSNEKINSEIFVKSDGSGMRYSGSWNSSNDSKKSYFVPFYSDYFFGFDNSGNVIYKAKTIDGQKQNLKIIKENNRYYLSPTVSLLRLGTCTSGNDLFLSSFVREDRQTKRDFNENLTIDVYNLDNGRYKFSFYLPNFSNKRPDSFTISATSQKRILYALYNKTIVLYDISSIIKNEG